MSTKPTVLILDSKVGVGITVQMVQCLAAADTFAIEVATPHRDSILKHSRWVRGVSVLPQSAEPAAWLAGLKALLRERKPDVLLPANVDQIDMLIRHADDEIRSLTRLTPQPRPDNFQTACSKSQLSAFMESHGIPHPRTVRFDPADSAMPDRLRALRFPVIAKPTWGGGGSGMRVFESFDGLVPHLVQAASPENPVIVQEFIRGHDLGTAVFCLEGRILYQTMQRNMSPDPTSFRPSKGLRFFDDPKVREVSASLMGPLGWDGIAQIDLRVEESSGDIFVLEINPRYWGSVLGSQRMGINFPEIACRCAMGLPLPPAEYRNGKYITAMGYLLHLRNRLMGRRGLEDFTYADSAFGEMVSDPMPRVVEVIQKLTRRK